MKDDRPPLRLTVGAGKLTPADAFSAERLDSYRHGTTLFFQPVTDPQSVLRRKFWAILGAVIKNCETPWRTTKDAANAIKRFYGLMDEGGTIGGVRVMYPRSLNDLTEPEFEEFYEDAMLYLHRITGVDPETLSRESPDPGDDEPPAPSSLGAGVGGGDVGSTRSPKPASPAATPLRAECIDKFLQFAEDDSLPVQSRLENLAGVQTMWADEMPEDADFVRACRNAAEGVIKGETTEKEARRYLSALAEVPKENGR